MAHRRCHNVKSKGKPSTSLTAAGPSFWRFCRSPFVIRMPAIKNVLLVKHAVGLREGRDPFSENAGPEMFNCSNDLHPDVVDRLALKFLVVLSITEFLVL